MADRIIPVEDKDSLARALRETHRLRFNLGKEDNARVAAEIERASRDGNELRERQLEERTDKKKAAHTRRLRQIEEREREFAIARVGAAIRREERRTFKRQPPAALYQQFERQGHPVTQGTRDLYYDWIGRGFSSGKKRNYAREAKRASSRTTPWKSGEMGRKIRYIFRDAALEEVEGNTLTNMGDDIVEAVHCAHKLEAIEKLSREGAGVYHHVIIALPHELLSSQRAELLAKMVKPLRDLALPFCASLHVPDRNGDQRNFHAHVVVSLRPMKRVGSYEWEFATSKRTWLDTAGGIKLQRKFIAREFNRALSAAGHEQRWSHKSRADRGEASPGNNKVGAERTRAAREAGQAAKMRREQRISLLDANVIHRHLSKLTAAANQLDRCVVMAGQLLAGMSPSLAQSVKAMNESLAGLRSAAVRAVSPAPRQTPTRAQKTSPRLPVSKALLDAEEQAGEALVMATSGLSPVLIQAIRDAAVGGRLLAKELKPGHFRLFAEDDQLLQDWVTLVKTAEGQQYCRAIISDLTEPEDDELALPNLRMTRSQPTEDIDIEVLLGMTKRQRGKAQGV